MRKLILGLAVAWCGFWFLRETGGALEGYDFRQQARSGPQTWRTGAPRLLRLERCLAGVRERVPAGRPIAFASPEEASRDDFFRWRWAAYYLPEHDLLFAHDPASLPDAEYLVDYGRGVRDPRLELLARLHGCRLYRIRPR
jgi:hypothetical protein